MNIPIQIDTVSIARAACSGVGIHLRAAAMSSLFCEATSTMPNSPSSSMLMMVLVSA